MNTGSRHLGRQAALQMLYQWEVGRLDPAAAMALHREIEQEGPELPAAGRRFAEELVEGTIARLPEIDALIAAQPTHWRIERMAVVDRLILRMAVYELLGRPDTPPAVVIDEAIELARAFSEEDAAGFVNGVLDGVLRAIAPGRPAHT